MKATYIFAACLAVALMSEFSLAQIGPVGGLVAGPILPPVFPPMFGLPFFGLGLGFPFLGGLGFGGLGFGGLGFGLGRRFLGKREVNATVNEIRCTISTSNNTIQCSLGVEKTIGCQMEPRLTEIPKLKVNLVDLSVIEHVDGNVEFLNLVASRVSSKLIEVLAKANVQPGTFSFIHPGTLKPVLLSVYGDATLGVPGFLVNDPLCYSSLVSVIKANIGNVRTNLLIA